LSRVSPVQYSPRRRSRWVLANYDGVRLLVLQVRIQSAHRSCSFR